jgi:hypothetical protein
VIWREWRHSTDPEYGHQLFELVADTPAGWTACLSLTGLDMLTGASVALVLGFTLSSSWEVLRQFIWAGMLVGGVFGYLAGQNLSWRSWLHRLVANTPTTDWPRFIGNALLLGFIGGLIFGPIFFLGLAGLFWGIGGLLPWLNRGSVSTNPTSPEERRWWFWWWRRPWLLEVEAALAQACHADLSGCGPWQPLLQRLADKRSQQLPPNVLAQDLLSQDWQERFIATYVLASQGQQAAAYLQLIIPKEDDETPFRQAVDWLLLNLRREEEHVAKRKPQRSEGGSPT